MPADSTPQGLQLFDDIFHHYEPQEEAVLLSESLEFAETSTGKCEDLLEWDIFEGKYHRSETETLIFNPDAIHHSQQGLGSSVEADPDRRSTCGWRGVQEEDILRLIQRFLANVHIKNPILNADDIKRMGKDVMEHGLRWDAPSCLVVCSPPLRFVYFIFLLLLGLWNNARS